MSYKIVNRIAFRRAGIATAVALTAAIAMSGCAAAQPVEDEVHLALSLPLTGPSAAYGVETLNAINLAVTEINADGGIDGRQVRVSEFDDECEATAAANAAQQILSDDTIFAVIGNVCSGAVLAQLPIFSRADMPVFAAASSNPTITEQGYENFARIVPTEAVLTTASVRLITKVLGLDKLAVLYPSDDYGQSLNAVVEEVVAGDGAEVVASETYVPGTTSDFSSVLSNMAAAGPDAIFLAGYYGDMGAAVQQLPRAFGSTDVTLVGNVQIQNQDYVDLAGTAGEGTWISNMYDVDNTDPKNVAFKAAYEKAYGVTPGVQGVLGYDNVYVLKEAIETHEDGWTNVIEAIKDTRYDGVLGPIEFDETGNNVVTSSVVVQLRDGTWVFDAEKTKTLREIG